ncbi:hypothetical protein E1B28_005946 [Marasmius oreades]|uniref:Uncharacterized protein n=1 Tax=Marasmius oreades TaxID=181124 RepID=A0A9P7S4X1_9AGAR|nr:uncharacterized protein E1B28_005946 [Marasmius oreades]KAG7095167.1 hypothetical protein E1B28_005946 [Marasmius oreades]
MPWDPGQDDIHLFWQDISDLCFTALGGNWSMYGDYNATLASCERASTNAHQTVPTQAYSAFLLRCGGMDLWAQILDGEASTHYTYKGPFGQIIIDCMACSVQSMLESQISVYRKFMGSTNHRAVKGEMVAYFKHLFHHEEQSPNTKPWLSSPSLVAVRNRTALHPFKWPKPLSTSDLCLILHHGKACPSPGPDQWEKWWFKSLDDSGLQPLLNIVNYIITHSHFPASIKLTYLSIIHKRGSTTSMKNYRGICCHNLIVQTACAWLNFYLTKDLAKHKVIPHTQVATQPSVQGRELLSFLAQLHAWSSQNQQPLYILQ